MSTATHRVNGVWTTVIYRPRDGPPATVPLYLSPGACGFPSPADDFVEAELNLHDHVVKHPAATFFMRASGDSMVPAGIHPGDLLVVDRSLRPGNGSVVVAAVDGELTVKRLRVRHGASWLAPDDDAYPAIELRDDRPDVVVWGVVTFVLHRP